MKLPSATNPKAGVSLNEAAAQLKQALGEQAPSRITLHRHSKAGSLRHMVCRSSGARDYYDASRLIEHYSQAKPAAKAQPSETPTPAPALPADFTATVQDIVHQALRQALEPLQEQMGRIDRGLADLASTRASLMMKYDAGHHQMAQQLDQAKQEIARLRTADQSEHLLTKIRIDISRLTDAVNALKSPH